MRAIQGLSSACRPKANMSKSVSLRTRSRPVTADRPGTIDCISCSIRGRKAASRGSKRCCRSQMQVRMATSAQQHVGSDAQQGKAKVVGMGLACWDYLAQVAQFPQPDEKIRTLQLQTQGGGNAGNSLTAASRLGADCYLVTKLGDDGIGDQIANELQGDGVGLSFVLRAEDSPSNITYLIIDKAGGTRTCIQTHSDKSEFAMQDLQPETVEQILSNASLVYFDGRLTQAATLLAKAARSRGVPVLVEAERLRPGLDELLQEADFICTSAAFPELWTGEANLGDSMLACLERLPQAQWMITTLGKQGSALIHRSDAAAGAERVTLNDKLEQMLRQVASNKQEAEPTGCTTKEGLQIRLGNVASTETAFQLQYTKHHADNNSSATQVQSGETSSAFSNAAAGVQHSSNATATRRNISADLTGKVTVASAAGLAQEAVQDTTGAGDAFIGTVLYAITTGLSHEKMLKLAALVAASGCTAIGSRPALPHAHQITPELLLPRLPATYQGLSDQSTPVAVLTPACQISPELLLP